MAYYKKGGSFNKEKGSQTDIYTEINNKILEMIQGGKIPWRRTWKELKDKELKDLGNYNHFLQDLPYNPVTKTVYRGVNHLMLKYIEPYFGQTGDPRFLTFNNIQEGKYSLKKGSKATYVFFAKRIVPTSKTDSSSDTSEDPTKPGYSILKKYPVFHASCIENYPSYAEVREQQLSELQRKTEEMMKNRPELFEENVFLQNIITNGRVKIEEIPNQNPCYILSQDKILMPPVLQWESKNEFNGTLLHELSHWTGHVDRKDRDLTGRFGSKEYAFEELVAELSKTYTCSQIDIDPNYNKGAAYIQGWITLLEDNPKAFFQAASKAQEASDYLLDLGYPKELTKELDAIKKSQIENSIEIGGEKETGKTANISTEDKPSIQTVNEKLRESFENGTLITFRTSTSREENVKIVKLNTDDVENKEFTFETSKGERYTRFSYDISIEEKPLIQTVNQNPQPVETPSQIKIFDEKDNLVKMENVHFTGIQKELGGGTMVFADIEQKDGKSERRTSKLSTEEITSLPNLSHVEKIKLAEKHLITDYNPKNEVKTDLLKTSKKEGPTL